MNLLGNLLGNSRAGIAGSDDLITENGLACVLKAVDVDHGLREGLRGFLWQIVADAAGDDAAVIFAGEFLAIGRWVRRVRRTIGVAFEGDGGHGDCGKLRELLFEFVILRFAVSKSEAKAVVVNHDGDVIGIVEGCRGAIECGIVEVPFGRSNVAR